MTRFEAALLDLAAFLDDRRLPYMVIGGFANLHWGIDRFTRDLDVTVEVAGEALPGLLAELGQSFRITVAEPLEFARRNHLIRIQTRTGVDVDLILAALPYESAAIRRAVPVALGTRSVRLCSPEDLIVHRLAPERTQDLADEEGIIERRAGELDLSYLRPLIRDLVTGLERPSNEEVFERALRRAEHRSG